jgi:hypothetical protein
MIKKAALVLAMLSPAGFIQAGDATVEKRYRLPERGYLQMNVPASWEDEVHQPRGALPPTIGFRARRGKQFAVLVTPIWPARPDISPQTKDAIKRSVQSSADQVRHQAIEENIAVVELPGASGPGFYFSATDSVPKPDEYKFMTQGIIRVSDLVVTFTILTNDGQLDVTREALAAIQSAVHIPPR